MIETTKEKLLDNYVKSFAFANKPSGKEYVTLEQNNANDNVEFTIYANRLAGWLSKRFEDNTQKQLSKGSLLEIGCGVGRLIKPLSSHFKWVTGVDISSDILNEAKVYLRDIPNQSLFENDGKSLSLFDDNYFDFVVTSGVLQHIPHREIIAVYLEEAVRVLKEDGLFLFTFQVWQTNIEGKGRIGAKITAQWLEEVFKNLPVEFIEATFDTQDPIPHISVLVCKRKEGTGVSIELSNIVNLAWRTECWEDLKSMSANHDLEEKGQRKVTFFDDE